MIEFRNDRITIVRSHREAAPPGYAVVPFKYGDNRGMRVDVMVGPVKTTALIDTGAQVTVGNLALQGGAGPPAAASTNPTRMRSSASPKTSSRRPACASPASSPAS